MMNTKKKKFFGTFIIVILLGGLYMLVRSSNIINKNQINQNSNQNSSLTENSNSNEAPQETKESYNKLLYRLTIASKKTVNEIYLVDLITSSKKLVFTDADEEFSMQFFGGIKGSDLIVFAPILNETTGSIRELKTDGSGGKKDLLENFSATAFNVSGDRIAFVSYNNIEGKFSLWLSGLDDKNKKNIYESETPISDPQIMDGTIAFVSLDSNANATIMQIDFDGNNKKEILKGNSETIFSLSYGGNKLAYIKTPSGGGKENLAEVYVLNLSDKKEKPITSDKEADQNPVLSPDGNHIAFAKKGKIWSGKSDGSDIKQYFDGIQPIGFIN